MRRAPRHWLLSAVAGLYLSSAHALAMATDDPLFAIKLSEGRFEPAQVPSPRTPHSR